MNINRFVFSSFACITEFRFLTSLYNSRSALKACARAHLFPGAAVNPWRHQQSRAVCGASSTWNTSTSQSDSPNNANDHRAPRVEQKWKKPWAEDGRCRIIIIILYTFFSCHHLCLVSSPNMSARLYCMCMQKKKKKIFLVNCMYNACINVYIIYVDICIIHSACNNCLFMTFYKYVFFCTVE